MNEELQQQYYQLEMYGQQVQKLQEELEKIELMKMELLKSIDSMEGLKDSEDILIPLGGGAFIKAKAMDTKKVIMGAGADVFLEKDISDVVVDFNKSIEDLDKAGSMIIAKIEETAKVAEQMQKDLEEKVQAMEGQMGGAPTLQM
ncbi:prefoldin subunit alpha [Methanococcus aeolicus]|uniref:Prefoldin subunit alpha n=1 Tax=Methanococcus aeolicus (strain ATCC BAA-1280 / DSM 17508 / OCM 812 / Nankai-3) TaxID=419665 RepID=PFDA_META3|nr:prefoldin subunit alpha [Methanococcus aeolicus]A6UWR8.1 RecName: Full=Prefoldin subunit alpha; AltName: Full=GimC subunit alpha [Methanococcus aeolicus Nankai-3]ABR56940.1 prefoldin, alpha subunit [Methanococcus aeolicus Nankai-3]UXM84938.1 prefoldin subunit alpha [Methanococcus aeolicus]